MTLAKYCPDVEELIATQPDMEGCCPSCHEDDNEGYTPLPDDEYQDELYIVCCAQLRNLDRLREISDG